MKRIWFLFSLVCLLMIIHSCNLIEYGRWKDNIHLSAKSAEFSSAGDSVTITTEGTGWWVSSVSVDGVNYFDFQGIDREADHYTIKQDCFVVERRDKNTLFIKVDANPTNVKRIINVVLEAGDYHDAVTVTQN
jgi:hypothetical protein